jgi:type I restriction enzyme S subunit
MKLNDVCELIIDTEHKTAPNVDEGIPSIRTPNVGKGRLILDKEIKYVDEATFEEWTKRATPQKDDLIIAREAPVGNVALVPELQLCLGQRTVLARPDKKKIYPPFLCYYLLSPKMQYKMLAGSGGSTVAHLNMKDIRNLELDNLPPLQAQCKIANMLTAYDDLIENNLKRIKLLEEAARIEYLMLVKDESEFTEYSIEEVCDTIGGGTPSTKENRYWEDGAITWFSPTDLTRHNSIVLLDSEKKISALGLEKSSAKLVTPKSILMTSRATIGYFGLINKSVCTNQGFINIVPFKEHYRTYMLFNLMSRKDELISNANGTTYLEISKGNFRKMKIKIPKNEKLLEALESSFALKFNLIENLLKQNNKLREARDILLPRLMNGEIEV